MIGGCSSVICFIPLASHNFSIASSCVAAVTATVPSELVCKMVIIVFLSDTNTGLKFNTAFLKNGGLT
jgi:hypothetical protein